MAKRRKTDNRQVLVVLVMAVIIVSLVGTWLVLQSGFSGIEIKRTGTVSFYKESGPSPISVIERNPEGTGVVSFVKEG